jgi:hypothetical protein
MKRLCRSSHVCKLEVMLMANFVQPTICRDFANQCRPGTGRKPMKFNTLESAIALFTLASLSYAEAAETSVMSVPHDSNIYTRAATPEDLRRRADDEADAARNIAG